MWIQSLHLRASIQGKLSSRLCGTGVAVIYTLLALPVASMLYCERQIPLEVQVASHRFTPNIGALRF